MAKGFTRPIVSAQSIVSVLGNLLKAHNDFSAHHKSALIVSSNSSAIPHLAIGDLVDVYVRTSDHKHGKWLMACSVLDKDQTMGIAHVLGVLARVTCATFENVRSSF